MPAAKRKPVLDPLDAFAAADSTEALKLLFWKRRHENPAFAEQITPEDLQGFHDCVNFLEVKPGVKVQPKIVIHRPGGVPARLAQQVGNKLIPGKDAIPPKDYVVVQMVDQDGNGFVPIENSEEARERQIQADQARRVRERATIIAGQLATDLSMQTFSTATIQDAIAALRALSQ